MKVSFFILALIVKTEQQAPAHRKKAAAGLPLWDTEKRGKAAPAARPRAGEKRPAHRAPAAGARGAVKDCVQSDRSRNARNTAELSDQVSG